MAAVIVPTNATTAPRPTVAPRPTLRVIPGGPDATRRRRLHPAVYRRRRLGAALAALVLVAVVALAVIGATSLVSPGSAGSAEPTAASPPPAASPAGEPGAAVVGAAYLVQPGDTVWAIARRLQPEGDVRPLVDRIVDRTNGGALVAGQRLDLDGLVG